MRVPLVREPEITEDIGIGHQAIEELGILPVSPAAVGLNFPPAEETLLGDPDDFHEDHLHADTGVVPVPGNVPRLELIDLHARHRR